MIFLEDLEEELNEDDKKDYITLYNCVAREEFGQVYKGRTLKYLLNDIKKGEQTGKCINGMVEFVNRGIRTSVALSREESERQAAAA